MDAWPRRLCLALAFGPERHADSYAKSNPDSYSYSKPNAHTYSYSYSHGYTNGHSNAYCDADTYRIANSLTDPYTYTHAGAVAQYLYPGASVDRR